MLKTKDSSTKTTIVLCDGAGAELHVAQEVFKASPRIVIHPYTFSRARGAVQPRKIAEIEYKGWPTIAKIPTAIRPNARFAVGDKRSMEFLRALVRRFPSLTKVVFTLTGTTKVATPTTTFKWSDFERLVRAVGRELTLYDIRRKATVRNRLAELSTDFRPAKTELPKGGLSHLLEPYGGEVRLSEEDTDRLLDLVGAQTFGKVSVTNNFLRTKDKINVAYLEDVIDGYERLMKAMTDNEKAWQAFFDLHGWILGNVFPYQVILTQKEAYVGGKTIANKEGRVVDFLFQNGFCDNYALLEIKTHLTKLMKPKAYREPEAFAQHEDCAGSLSQCLDQKQTFMNDIGNGLSLDPKVVLLIGRKSELNDKQARAFELLRRNQKNVDIVTFDELLAKLKGLRAILQTETP